MPIWTAEVTVDEPLVRRLLAQFDELDLRSVKPLAEGWDYAVWLVDDAWAFRFPRRAMAVPGVENEIAVVPRLAPLLPIAVPAAVFIGRPTDEFPWPFFGSRFLPGRELTELELDEPQRAHAGVQLARFLRALHDADVDAELPVDPNERANMPVRVARTREQLGELERLGLWRASAPVEELLRAAEQLPPPRRDTLVHGDLHVRQLLATETGELSGVLDWVDVCRSDPAIDLSMVWSFLSADGRAAFLAAYGPVDDDQLLRARVLAVSLSASLAHYGHLESYPAIEREALAGLARTVS